MTSYSKPRDLNLWLCPYITKSCCSIYDQFIMYNNWNKNVKPRMDEYFESIFDKVKLVLEDTEIILNADLEGMIQNSRKPQSEKLKLKNKLGIIRSKELVPNLRKALSVQKDNGKYMTKLRSAFYCTICDQKNHFHFKLDRKVMNINYDTCSDVAENTINFTYLIHVKIAPWIIKLLAICKDIIHSNSPNVEIKNLKALVKHVKKCAYSYVGGGVNGKACRQYCEYFNVNATSAVIEGYSVFFNEVRNAMTTFIKDRNLTKNERKLASLLYRNEQMDKQRILSEGEGINWTQLRSIEDPYHDAHINPDFSDHVLNEMFTQETGYQKDREVGYKNFVLNQQHYFGTGLDFTADPPKTLFRTSTSKVVDLENYATHVGYYGIEIAKHIATTNISNPIKDLIIHLKTKSKFKIFYEKLDPTLLNMVNDVTNNDVANFHRDNFMTFKNFSGELKRNEMYSRMDEIIRTASQRGYNIGAGPTGEKPKEEEKKEEEKKPAKEKPVEETPKKEVRKGRKLTKKKSKNRKKKN